MKKLLPSLILTCAMASPLSAAELTRGTPMKASIGAVEYCARLPDDEACQPPSEDGKTDTDALASVNSAVNHRIIFETDQRLHGVIDYWDTGDDDKGDCEEYAIAKMKMLLGLGVPRGAMDIGVVFNENHEGHAVLVVHGLRDDWVLDATGNPASLASFSAKYEWLAMSVGGSFRAWTRVSYAP